MKEGNQKGKRKMSGDDKQLLIRPLDTSNILAGAVF